MLLTLQGNHSPAILALSDGTVFLGQSVGHNGKTVGELVFNTSMTGYQEILTDPSYSQQLVTLTYSHIGNYGVNPEDSESSGVYAAGLVIKNLPLTHSNFRATSNLTDFLKSQQTVAISDIDTRMLTRHLREKGSQNAAIESFERGVQITDEIINKAIENAKQAPSDRKSVV